MIRYSIFDTRFAVRAYVAMLLAGASTLSIGCTTDTSSNVSPIVVASAEYAEIRIGSGVRVDASKSHDADRDALTFAWSFSGPAGSQAKFDAANDATTYFRPDVEGAYTVTVTVSDGHEGKTSQSFSIQAVHGNVRPTASISILTANVVARTDVAFDGSKSSDPDPVDAITFLWSFAAKPGGSRATFSSETAIRPTAYLDVPGDYQVQLLVMDKQQAASDPVTVTLHAADANAGNHAPVAKPEASAASVHTGDVVTLDGTKSGDADAGDTLSYEWWILKKPSGSKATLDDAKAAKTTFKADADGEYVVTLVVTDSKGAKSDLGAVTVIAKPLFVDVAPTAKATISDAKVRPGTRVDLDGSGSHDPDAGDTLSYFWSVVSAPAASHATIDATDAVKAVIAFTPDVEGSYAFDLTVTDSHNEASHAKVILEASNAVNVAPVAAIAAPDAIDVGATLTLDGGASSDADGDALTYAWSIVSAPDASKAALASDDGAKTTFVPDAEGTYVFSLVVSDDHGGVSEPVKVAVHATAVAAPPTDPQPTDPPVDPQPTDPQPTDPSTP